MAGENSGGAEEKGSGASSQANGGGGKGGIATILSAVNLLVNVGIIAVLVISFQREKQRASIEDISVQSPSSGEGGGGGGGEGGAGGGGKSKEGGGEGGESKEGDKKSPIDFGRMVTLEAFTVNLATPGSVNPKFVRVNISLEVPTDVTENELNAKNPQVRNAIIDIFNSKKPSDLATPDGREYLKDEIKNALNAFLVSGKVKGVYFTSFALSV